VITIKTLYVFGAGHGAIELLENMQSVENVWTVCIEDNPKQEFLQVINKSYPILPYSEFEEMRLSDIDCVINSVMDCSYKQKMYEANKKLNWINAVNSHSIVLCNQLGKGIIIQPFCFVGSTSTVGNFVKLNHYARIQCAHIGDYSFMGSGSQILGDVVVGSKTLIYSGVTVLPGVKIGNNTVIGAGSIVTKDIPDNVIAYGNPCKVVREVAW